jgi:hypothetical protein
VTAGVVERVVDQERFAVLGHPAGEGALTDGDPEPFVEVALPEQAIGIGDRLAESILPVHDVDANIVVGGERARLRHDRIGDGLDIGQAVEP